MNERIVFTKPDGSCGVIIPSDNAFQEININIVNQVTNETHQIEDEPGIDFNNRLTSAINSAVWDIPKFLDFIQDKDVPVDAANIRQITIAELPVDRLFRNAWDDSNPENFIGTNLVKAQAIAHDMRRVDRETKLAPLDKEVAFAGASSSRKTAINIERNDILNANANVQTDIDNAVDEAALRATLTTAAIA